MSRHCPIEEIPQNLSWILPSASKVDLSHEEVEAAIQEYLARGGTIVTLPPQPEISNNGIPVDSVYEPLDFLNWAEETDTIEI